MELMDIPCDIDLERLEESYLELPHDWWNYTEYQGSWYHKEKDRSVIQTRSLLKLAKRDYGIEFKTLEEVSSYIYSKLDEPLYFHCAVCDFKTENEDKLNRHEGTNACRIRKLKFDAKQKSEVYVPPHKQIAYCRLCNETFKNKYSLERHYTSNPHKEKLNVEPIPTNCLVCKQLFDLKNMAKTRRHLKTAKKCHRVAVSDPEKRKKWVYMYLRFRCKFDKHIIDKSAKKPTLKVLTI